MKETDGDGSVINNPAFREINYAIIRYKEIRRKRRAEINEVEAKKPSAMINETKSWSLINFI